MNINITLPNNRLHLGSVKVLDKNDITIVDSICLGLSDNQYAESFSNPTHDPLKIGGNTPYGSYKCTIELFKNPTEQDIHSYGTYGVIHLEAISGDALVACGPLNKETGIGGRTGLLIHGGVLNVTYVQWNGLRVTHGCVRVFNETMELIFKAIAETEDTNIICNIIAA